MEKEQHRIIISISVIVIAIFTVFSTLSSPQSQLGFSSAKYNVFSGGVTNTSTTVSVASEVFASSTDGFSATQILARNASRQYARIQNLSSVDTVTLWFTDTATDVISIDVGIVLEGGASSTSSFYEIGPDNLWKGAVYGVSGNASSVVATIEK